MPSPAYRIAPLASRLRGKLGIDTSVAAVAVRTWVVAPGAIARVRPAVFDEDDLAKIVGVAPNDVLEREVGKTRGGLESHDATLAHEVRDAVLTGGHLFTQRMVFNLDLAPLPLWAPRIEQELDHAVLASSHYGIRYFGHWLIDDMPRTLAAQALGAPFSTLQRPTPHQTHYLGALGIDVPVMSLARFRTLVILADHGQNGYKRERYAALRKRLRSTLSPRGSGRVMLLRGGSGDHRLLVNQPEVALAMRGRGFEVFDPETASFADMASACLDADLVLGVEGSHLANGVMWMKTTGTLAVIQPPERFSMYFKDRCDCEGMRFAFIVGDSRGAGEFTVDIDRLNRLLDRLT